ncbi:MAG: prepilin-type N-terminal cleavage/methylation domain-containing protein [Acidobacteria bacterium]|nr:prepilin-type N-terminal cleavage/methylation domain-containing protein [Acidobacteriota bacterium]
MRSEVVFPHHPVGLTPSPLPRTSDTAARISHGFTLLELLISLTIVALIFVTVLGAIQVGSRSWESGEQRSEENQRTRTLYDTLARELTMLYPLRIKGQGQEQEVVVFRGKPDSLEFATLPQSYGAEPFSHMIRIVSYGVESGRGLVATDRYPLTGGAVFSGPREDRVRQLDERVLEARFRYLVPEGRPEEKRPPAWRDFWDPSEDVSDASSSRGLIARAGQPGLRGSDRLPLAVEISLTIRQEARARVRELVLPPLVFPVQVGRTL